MYNLENFLVQYATFNWQHLYIDSKLYQYALNILCIFFALISLTKWISSFRDNKKLSSKSTQTDTNFPELKSSNENVSDSGEILLESIFNQKVFRNYILHSWITNFNEFQFSKIISKNCQIVEFNQEMCEKFKISQLKTIDNKEIVTFTFRLTCAKLFVIVALEYDERVRRQAHLIMTDVELSALVIIRVSENGLLLKFFPDCVSDLHCELVADSLSGSEREMSLAEFRRDFKLVMLQTIEMEWKTQIAFASQRHETSETDGHSPIDTTENLEINTSPSQSFDDSEILEETHIETEATPQHTMTTKTSAKEFLSHMSLFTTDSYDICDPGEESPFHDRFSSKLVGRTLVVGLIKVVEAQELKNPLKNGYCVLELDEPYQRHVSHLISLTDFPIWNQHFVFSLNSNSQRMSVELFHASKKCQNPTSLGVSVIPISLIIVDPSENYFPINNNQTGSRKSWRCDVIAGGVDSKIPAFLIEFQIMKSVYDPSKATVDPPSEISSSNSGIFVPGDNFVKSSDSVEPDLDNGHKMQTIPEAQTPDSTLTKSRVDSETKALLREKPNNDNDRPKSVIRKIRHRFSRLSVPWLAEKSKSDDCLDHIADETQCQVGHKSEIPVQPPAELFMTASKPKFFTKASDVDLQNSRSLSISLKKVFNIPSKKMGKNDQYKEKSLEQLFKVMDPKFFDTISNEGFNRIMNNK